MRPARTFPLVSLCLILMAALPVWVGGSAAAQQQEKRIALVVGDGAYSKGQLATAANNAGLIAQTLQAAGFDVIGARDLDGDTLRKSFHDFIQKAQNDGQQIEQSGIGGTQNWPRLSAPTQSVARGRTAATIWPRCWRPARSPQARRSSDFTPGAENGGMT